MRVGFIHGVMNTDNMTISGETIDYGPCAFMNSYDPETVFSSIDHHGRYAYFNQPGITKWNLSRFAETLLPLIDNNQEKAIEIAKDIINKFGEAYKSSWLEMMKKKLGLFGEEAGDEILIDTLLLWMKKNKADFTNTFLSLAKKDILKNKIFKGDEFANWYQKWQSRLKKNGKSFESSLIIMAKNNPVVIPRNHKVEEALEAANNKNDLIPMLNLLKIIKNPYDEKSGASSYQNPPPVSDYKYQTFCGT